MARRRRALTPLWTRYGRACCEGATNSIICSAPCPRVDDERIGMRGRGAHDGGCTSVEIVPRRLCPPYNLPRKAAERRVHDAMQRLARGPAGGLDRHAFQHGHDVTGEIDGIYVGRQVALRLGALEALLQFRLAG